ncbi:hypothetical protein QCA50_015758 [Cerrena zonata]|uniref:C2H2-type domain-containing protein n=1 Tax=Cerrena zonata TaxID=2478898 RepID=A0AAW0FHD7_9APHY
MSSSSYNSKVNESKSRFNSPGDSRPGGATPYINNNAKPNKNPGLKSNVQDPGAGGVNIPGGYPNFYMGHRDSSNLPFGNVGVNTNDQLARPRGDSIFLPPPINLANLKFGNDYDANSVAQGNSQGNNHSLSAGVSRSNSIFSSLIQIPGSNGNSVSGPSSKQQLQQQQQQQQQQPSNSAGGINQPGQKSRQVSFYPGTNPPNDYPLSSQDLESYFGKESLSNILNWNQQRQQLMLFPQQQQQQQPKQRNLIDQSNSFWEGLNMGLSGSVSGLPITNDSLNGILASLSNGSIDFSGMSNEQRRDSILKLINDQQQFQQRTPTNTQPAKTRLREDIFDKSKTNQSTVPGINNQQYRNPNDPNKPNLQVPNNDKNSRISPASSLSSKSSAKFDEPQSPKTSPSIFNARVLQTRAPPLQSNPQASGQSFFAQKPQQQPQPQQQLPQQPYQNYPGNPYNYNYPNQPQFSQQVPPQYSSPFPQQQQQHPQQLPQHPQHPPQHPQQINPAQAQINPAQAQIQPNLLKPGQQNYYQPQDRQNYSYQPIQSQNQAIAPQDSQQSPSISTQQLKADPVSQQQSPNYKPNARQARATTGAPPAKRSRNAKKGSKNNSSDSTPIISGPLSTAFEKNLVPAQQYAKSEDGRPLLGATKVDQLMLVIQAREKGNTNTIQQGVDGSILGSPDNKNSVLPQSVNLVGGVDKPEKGSPGSDDKKKGRRHKTQQCPYCFKFFNQSTHLEVHVRSHIGHKPFECSYCHKRFTQGGNLRTHLRLHTGEKPFTCDICKRSFSRKGNLAAHQLTHNNEKPFECKLDDCDKSFTQLGNLKAHQNRFHLPTLNRLTHTLAEMSGENIANLPLKERELLDHFKELYKNSNKGIRGRGKRQSNAGHDGKPDMAELSMSPPPGGRAQPSQQPPQQQQMSFMNPSASNY